MEGVFLTELGFAGAVVLISAAIGAWAQGPFGGILLGSGALLASGLSIAGTWLGLTLLGTTGGWLGLAAGILLAALLAWLAGNWIVRGHSGRFAALLWLGFCAVCVFGYLAGEWIGFLTITLPAIAVFWIGLFRVSAYILPRRDDDQRPRIRLVRARDTNPRPQFYLFPLPGFLGRLRFYVSYWLGSQWRLAFRSLITFTMGTNYPCYSLRDGRAEMRLTGNPSQQFFGGPGWVYARCDHAGYRTDGVQVKGIVKPGLNFTQQYDLEPKAIDLRPQLCSFLIQAKTRDGVPIEVQAHVPFRIQPGKRVARPDGHLVPRRPELGRPFPVRRQAVHRIARQEPVEKRNTGETAGLRHNWATDLVPLLTAPILQDIIGRYSVDELCAALDPDRLPCVEIVNAMNERLETVLTPYGLELVVERWPQATDGAGAAAQKRRAGLELLGGWIGNLLPESDTVDARRLDNWRTEWERRILLLISEAKAERARQIEKARADAELNILWRFGQLARAISLSDPASQTALALRFIDCLGEVVSEAEGQWPLPEPLRDSLRRIRGQLEEGQR